MPTFEQMTEFIKTVGFPGAILVYLAYVAYRAGEFLAPKVSDLVEATKTTAVGVASVEAVVHQIKAGVDELLSLIKDETSK